MAYGLLELFIKQMTHRVLYSWSLVFIFIITILFFRVLLLITGEERSDSASSNPDPREKVDTDVNERASVDDSEIKRLAGIDSQRASHVSTAGSQTAGQIIIPSDQGEELDGSILELIGNRLIQEKILATDIHKDLAIRWKDVLIKGLPLEDKTKLIEKYPPPANCIEIMPPKLNAEVKASLQEAIIKKDTRVVTRQQRIAACLASLGKSLSLVLKTNHPEHLTLLENLSDAARLLADVQHDDSQIRRSLILSSLNTSVKDTLNSSPVDEWLFGKDLDEQVKAAKLLERSTKDLKPEAKLQGSTSKNSKGPPNRPFYKKPQQMLGGKYQQYSGKQQQYSGRGTWKSHKPTRGQNRGYMNQGQPKKWN